MASHLLAVALVMCLSSTAQAKTDVSSPHHITIAKSSVEQALKTLAQQTGVQLLFPFDLVKTLQAEPLRGDYTVMQALDILLKDTGLSGSLTDSGVITISQIDLNSNGKGKDDMNIKTKKSLLATLIAFFATGAVTQGVMAQDVNNEGQTAKKQNQIDEIIVTAQKREERLIDVPMSISVVGSEEIKNRGIQNVTDLSYAVPNLFVVEREGGAAEISIRGVSNFAGSSALVGIYLDEIPLSITPYIKPDLQAIDIQQIEVLKGPQGMLYGQGSVGGTVRFITNAPEMNELNGDITASIYDTANGSSSNELTMVANLPVIDDQLAFRVAGTYKDKGGWIDRVNDNARDINDNELSHIRISGLWEPSDKLSITAMAIRHRNDIGALNLVNTTPASDSKYLQPVRNGLGVAATANNNGYDIYNLVINYDLDFAALTSSTSKSTIETAFTANTATLTFGPAPGTTFDLFQHNPTYDAKGLSQELRLTSTSDSRMNWTLGVFYDDVEDRNLNTGADLYFSEIPLSISTATTIIDSTSKSTSVFGNISYSITDKLTVDLGGRYYEDDKSQLFVFDNVVLSDKTASFDNTSFRGALSYALTESANIYFSVSQGFRSGGMNFFSPLDYKPEKILSYEVGGKATLLDNTLSVEAALYYSDYTDYQAASADQQLRSIISNPGEAEIQGIEWSTLWTLSDYFSLGFNGNYTESEFTKINPSSTIFQVGDPLTFIPKYNYSLSANFDFQWSDKAQGFANIDYSRQAGSSFINRSIGLLVDVSESEDIGFLNAQIGAQFDSISIKLFGRNLDNELSNMRPAIADNEVVQNRPRTIGLELNYQF